MEIPFIDANTDNNSGMVTYSVNGKVGTIPKSQEAAFKKKIHAL